MENHPEDAILTLEELENIIILGFDLWLADFTRLIVEEWKKPYFTQGFAGLKLNAVNRGNTYVTWLNIPDPSFTYSTLVRDMYLFHTQQAAQNAVNWKIGDAQAAYRERNQHT